MPFTVPSTIVAVEPPQGRGDPPADADEQQVVELVEPPLVERRAVQEPRRRGWRSTMRVDAPPAGRGARKTPNSQMPSDEAEGGRGDADEDQDAVDAEQLRTRAGVAVAGSSSDSREHRLQPAARAVPSAAERQAARQRCRGATDGIASRISGSGHRPRRLVDLAAPRAGPRATRRRTSCPSGATCRTRSCTATTRPIAQTQ